MARVVYWRDLLKNDLWGRLALLAEEGSARDLIVTPANYHWRDRIWNPRLTFWTFLVQVLHPGSACREAVALVLAPQAGTCERRISPDASAYCQARRRLPLSVFVTALRKVGRCLQGHVRPEFLWQGRRVRVVDGSRCSMPDTPELQTQFGQPEGQKPGEDRGHTYTIHIPERSKAVSGAHPTGLGEPSGHGDTADSRPDLSTAAHRVGLRSR